MSRWLADACAVIGFYRAAPDFPASARALMEDRPQDVAVAATTVWEIAIKTARGKLADIRTSGHATLDAGNGIGEPAQEFLARMRTTQSSVA